MDSRRFINDVFRWSADVGLAIPNFTVITEVLAAEKPQSLIVLTSGEEYQVLSAGCLRRLAAWANLSIPATGWSTSPTSAGTGHRNKGPTPIRWRPGPHASVYPGSRPIPAAEGQPTVLPCYLSLPRITARAAGETIIALVLPSRLLARQTDPLQIRPPGALPEMEFLGRYRLRHL